MNECALLTRLTEVDTLAGFKYTIKTVNNLGAKTMSRKHFITLANEIRQIEHMASRLAAAIAVCKAARVHNDRFDQARFLTACEV